MQQIRLVLALLPIIWSICVGENWSKHHSNDEVKAIMDGVHSKCSDHTRVYSLPEPSYDGVPDQTVNNQKLWVIEFSTFPGLHTQAKPEFKYIGNMHGNEVVGKEILLRLIVFLCDVIHEEDITLPTDSKFTREYIVQLLQNTNIHIMPSMNPDGWKKANEVTNKKSEEAWLTGRANGNNVDLNRNFPDLDRKYYLTENQPNHHNNHLVRLNALLNNRSLKLEPETKMVMAWIHSLPWVLSANMHGGDLVANYPFDEARQGRPNEASETPDNELFQKLALDYSMYHKKMAKKTTKKCDMNGNHFVKGTTNGADWYSVPGGMQDYNYLNSNCFEITLELGCVKFPEGDKLPELWEDNFDAMINYMFQSHIGIKGTITVPEEFKSVPVVIRAYTFDDETGTETLIDHDVVSTKYGDYFRLLKDGTYTIKAILPGGNEIVECVVVENNQLSGAMRVDFDFTNGQGKIEEGCREQRKQVDVNRVLKNNYEQDYPEYFLRELLLKMNKQNRRY